MDRPAYKSNRLSKKAMQALQADALQQAKLRLEAKREADSRLAQYEPFGAAKALFDYQGKSVLLSGPAGTGKSRAALEKLHYCAQAYAGMRGIILRKTRVSLTETTLVTFEDKVLGHGHPLIGNVTRGGRHAYTYPNGSTLVCGGLDKPTRHMSGEFDMVFISEAIELEEHDYELMLTRLRNGVMPYQQFIMDTNPDKPTHWLLQKCNAGLITKYDSYHEDNPTLYDRQAKAWTPAGLSYLATLDQLSGVRKQRLRYGLWQIAEGAVYDTWDDRIHVIDRFDVPETWRRFVSIDFGYNNPFVGLFFTVSPDGVLILYNELYMSKRTVADHVPALVKMIGDDRIEVVIADHDAEDRATLAQHGIATRAALKNISAGIQAVQQRLKVNFVTGKPRLQIMRGTLSEIDQNLVTAKLPTCTLEEIPGYQWAMGVDGRATKEVPIGRDDHGLDALRYAVMYLENYDPDGGVH